MFCKNCGKEIEETSEKCPYCGQKIDERNVKIGEPEKMSNIKSVSKEEPPKKKGKMKKILLAIGVLLVIIIVWIMSGSSEDEESGEVKTLEEVGGFGQWKADGFPGRVRANISVLFPLGNVDKNNYAVYIGVGGINVGIIMQEDEKPVKEWEWLMNAEPYEETYEEPYEEDQKAYFNGILKYLGTDDDGDAPVFLISDVKEGDYSWYEEDTMGESDKEFAEEIPEKEEDTEEDSLEQENIEEIITLPITVVNNTGVDIWKMYASIADTDDWEEDILKDNILYDGEEFVIDFKFRYDQLVWDFAIADSDNYRLEYYDVDFSNCNIEGATLVFEADGTASLK